MYNKYLFTSKIKFHVKMVVLLLILSIHKWLEEFEFSRSSVEFENI